MAELMEFVIIGAIFLFALGFVIMIFVKKGKFQNTFKEKPLKEIVEDDLKAKLNVDGIKVKKTKLFHSYFDMGFVEKYLIVKKTFASLLYDPKTQLYEVADSEEDVVHDLLIIRTKARSIFFRMFGIKKNNFILDYLDENGEKIIEFSPTTKKIVLPSTMTLEPYANVWLNSKTGAEYVNDVSIKRMVEQQQQHLVNIPDKTIFLEIEHTKKIATAKTFAEIDKRRYEEMKDADQSVVS